MKNPDSAILAVIAAQAKRARAHHIPADAATLALTVSRAFGIPYDTAARVCARKYRVQVVDRADAGKGMYCGKNPAKDGGPVRYEREKVLSVVDVNQVEAMASIDTFLGI